MEITHQEAVQRTPWNKGKLVGQNAPLKQREIWAIRIRLQPFHGAPAERPFREEPLVTKLSLVRKEADSGESHVVPTFAMFNACFALIQPM
ncbi:MAG: hypothetical protein JOZ49_02900 [Mycolicibacterium sp.]|nr:hypothetical protein [Mycolicibacterium sp.]